MINVVKLKCKDCGREVTFKTVSRKVTLLNIENNGWEFIYDGDSFKGARCRTCSKKQRDGVVEEEYIVRLGNALQLARSAGVGLVLSADAADNLDRYIDQLKGEVKALTAQIDYQRDALEIIYKNASKHDVDWCERVAFVYLDGGGCIETMETEEK